jgi:hypothetical protein
MNPETEKVIADLKEHYGIDVEFIVKKGLLPASAATKWLVRERYFDKAKDEMNKAQNGKTYAEIKYELSDCYGVSVSTIEKLIYRRRSKRTVNQLVP